MAGKASKDDGFSPEEREAMKERARETKKGGKAAGEADCLSKIDEMEPADRAMAERIHALIKEVAPQLKAKTWYGMPAYANSDGKVVCFFQSATKFKVRYATLGFNEDARLDDGNMWPSAYALLQLTDAEEARIAALVKQAAG